MKPATPSPKNRPPRVLFYEPNAGGHHFAYLARMLPGFMELPVDLALSTTPEALRSDEYASLLAPFERRLEALGNCRPLIQQRPLANALRRRSDLLATVRQWKPDHVCVMYGDGIWELAAIGSWLGLRLAPPSTTVEMWLYRGQFTYPNASSKLNQLRRRLFGRLLRSGVIAKMHFDDEIAVDYVNSLAGSKTEVVLPANPVVLKPLQGKPAARERLGLPPGTKVISLSGMIARYKGVHLAIEAFVEHAPKAPDNDVLLLAGPHADDVRVKLAEPPAKSLVEAGRIISLDRFLSADEMFAVAEASDLVLAPYPKHSGRSSIILWAAAAGTPVVATDYGCIDHVVRTQNLGLTCRVESVEDFAATIRRRLAEPWTEADADRVKQYAAWHRVENYQAWSSELARSRYGDAAADPSPTAPLRAE